MVQVFAGLDVINFYRGFMRPRLLLVITGTLLLLALAYWFGSPRSRSVRSAFQPAEAAVPAQAAF